MKCPYCKEEIAAGAKKCKECHEYLGFSSGLKRFTRLISGIMTLTVTIASLGLAYMEFQGRLKAEDERNVAVEQQIEAVGLKEKAEEETRATMSILEEVPKEVIADLARSNLERADIKTKAGFRSMNQRNFSTAEKRFDEVLQQEPGNVEAIRGKVFSRVLKRKK